MGRFTAGGVGFFGWLIGRGIARRSIIDATVGDGSGLPAAYAGLSTAEAGVRLRYEFTRQFAPYLGVVHERAFGRTADLRREEGEDVNDTRFVAGIRIWF